VRVVAGRWRGRRLQAPPGTALRPTTDRVKEALFSVLGTAVDGAEAIDLCCGAGGLGIEALSRGARRVEFVDESSRSLASVRRNLEACGAEPGSFIVRRRDALRRLEDLITEPAGPDLLFCDPPYRSDLVERIWNILTVAGAEGPRISVLEHPADLDLVLPPGCVLTLDRRRYGITAVSILER